MTDPRQRLRHLPSVDGLLRAAEEEGLVERFGREATLRGVRDLLDELREEVRGGSEPSLDETSLVQDLAQRLEGDLAPGLRVVINATGVVLHTNLGRAPLPREAVEALARTGGRYVELEVDLESGRRGRRGARLEEHVTTLTGAGSALVVNNNAGAVVLMLAALARDREVVVSRGELVEIGGSFRIPDVMAASGARMVEVGTTNRTHPRDYEAACGARTALLLKVHPSNFQVTGFTRTVALEELAGIGAAHRVPVAMDLGSGLLGREGLPGMDEELTVGEALEGGADLVTFSGDKALGGPQAGYIVGRQDLVDRCRRHPLMRALRPGRLTLVAAEATWSLCRRGRAAELPVQRMLRATPENLEARARAWAKALEDRAPTLLVEVIRGEGRVGGGTAPQESLHTALVSVASPREEAGILAERLRRGRPPVLARVREGRLLLDPRTVAPEEEEELLAAVASLTPGTHGSAS